MDKEQTSKSKKPRISPDRKDRFKWTEGDLKFFNSKEELEQHAKKNGEKITWYKTP